jgi:hypothetical protein
VKKAIEMGALTVIEAKRIGEEGDGLRAGARVNAALEVADPPCAEPGSFGQFLLGQPPTPP